MEVYPAKRTATQTCLVEIIVEEWMLAVGDACHRAGLISNFLRLWVIELEDFAMGGLLSKVIVEQVTQS